MPQAYPRRFVSQRNRNYVFFPNSQEELRGVRVLVGAGPIASVGTVGIYCIVSSKQVKALDKAAIRYEIQRPMSKKELRYWKERTTKVPISPTKLSAKTMKAIQKSRTEFSRGKYITLEELEEIVEEKRRKRRA